ncbi:MAG TPA: hypothetical protein VGP36_25885 [Mycobacteriales bacterium]|jgi:hypothetical protein|nr:hypothetical protein [Mycobacteriales bacterium]
MDDDEILTFLRSALTDEDEQPPERVVEAAVAAGDWVRLDGELAVLVADSADEPALAGIRGGTTARELSWALGELAVDCELQAGELRGQVRPAAGVTLSVLTPRGPAADVPVDPDGRFLLRPPGPTFALRCTRPGHPPAHTPWVLT